jgi:hypothetical protein
MEMRRCSLAANGNRISIGNGLMAELWGAWAPQVQFLLFCRLGLGTTEEVFSMCDYGLKALTHHDALEFSDGQIVLLTDLFEHQEATVLQLPAQSATAAERRPRNGSRTSAGQSRKSV